MWSNGRMIQELIYKILTIIGLVAATVILWEAISAIRSMKIRGDDDDYPN